MHQFNVSFKFVRCTFSIFSTKDSIEYRQKTLEGFKREKFNKNAYLKMLIAKQLK